MSKQSCAKKKLLTEEEKTFLTTVVKFGYAASFANYGISLSSDRVYLNFHARLKDGMIVREWSMEIVGFTKFKKLVPKEYYTWAELGIDWGKL